MEYAMEVDHLRRHYVKRVIDEDHSFEVTRCKVCVLLGKNGAGKTK